AKDSEVVDHQLGLGGRDRPGHPDGLDHPVPTRLARAPERPDIIGPIELSGGRLVTGHWLVDVLYAADVRLALGHGLEPFFDLLELLGGWELRDPGRLLGTPDEHVIAVW